MWKCISKSWSKTIVSLLVFILLLCTYSMTVFAHNSETEIIKLNRENKERNTAFITENMFPKDAVTKNYTIKISHKDPIILCYRAEIQEGSEKLAEVLKIKVEIPQKELLLYEGLMKDMPGGLEHTVAADTENTVYRITIYLDASVGNEYQNKSLKADFYWWYMEETGEDEDDDQDEEDGEIRDSMENEPNKIISAQTGDSSETERYILLLLFSLLTFMTLFVNCKKKQGVTAEDEG